MGYMQINPSDFNFDKPEIDRSQKNMTQSNPTYDNEFSTALPYSVDIAAEDPPGHFSMERQMVALEKQMTQLTTLRTALESEGKLTMNLAMECDMAIHDTQLVRTYFEALPASEKYDVAMEAMSGGMIAALAAVGAVVVALIVKLISMFKGGSSSGGGSGGGGSLSPTQVIVIETRLKDIKHASSPVEAPLNAVVREASNEKGGSDTHSSDLGISAAKKVITDSLTSLRGPEKDILRYGAYSHMVEKTVQEMLQHDPAVLNESMLAEVIKWRDKWLGIADGIDSKRYFDDVQQKLHGADDNSHETAHKNSKRALVENASLELKNITENPLKIITSYRELHHESRKAYDEVTRNPPSIEGMSYNEMVAAVEQNILKTHIRQFCDRADHFAGTFKKIEEEVDHFSKSARDGNIQEVRNSSSVGFAFTAKQALTEIFAKFMRDYHGSIVGTSLTFGVIAIHLKNCDRLSKTLVEIGERAAGVIKLSIKSGSYKDYAKSGSHAGDRSEAEIDEVISNFKKFLRV
jgi:hypothetical protein